MSAATRSRVLYAVGVIANFALTAFAVQLGAGKIPIPEAWSWVVPILAAIVTGAMMFLPRVGSEPISVQVDALTAQGFSKRDLAVVPKNEIESV